MAEPCQRREENEIREVVKDSDIDFIDGEECGYIFKVSTKIMENT